ncbi:hypothetical protein [Pelagibaculum spongiae]|nr:hypothetical protein [Pelagibaculum spongiae]
MSATTMQLAVQGINVSASEPFQPVLSNKLQGSLYFLIPDIDHGLRVNGVICSTQTGSTCQLSITVESAYMQCARAATRAQLWANNNPDIFNYGLLLTHNWSGKSEISPKGEPTDLIYQLNERQWAIPERPGNKVAISLRNILQTGKAAILLLNQFGHAKYISGACFISDQPELLSSMSVQKKPALLATVIEQETQLSDQPFQVPMLKNSTPQKIELTDFSKAMSQHLHRSNTIKKLLQPVVTLATKIDMKHLY